MDLYSINYLHYGAPKLWYGIPPDDAHKLERLARSFFPDHFRDCPAFLRHKMTVISPTVLKKYSVPFSRVVQREGQIVISFPRAYHSGFNLGLNLAESTNFATSQWIDLGKKAVMCQCDPDGVHIDMDMFVKKYQPDQYPSYLAQKKKQDQEKKRGAKSKSAKSNTPAKRPDLSEMELDSLTEKDLKLEGKMNEWCSPFSGLWRGQSPDNFIFESAFNLVMSQKGSRCSICALFEDPSPFQGFSREELLTTYWALKLNKKGGLMNPDTLLDPPHPLSPPLQLSYLASKEGKTRVIAKNRRGRAKYNYLPKPSLSSAGEMDTSGCQDDSVFNTSASTFSSDCKSFDISALLLDRRTDSGIDSCVLLEGSETFSVAEETVFALNESSNGGEKRHSSDAGYANGEKKARLSGEGDAPPPILPTRFELPRSAFNMHNSISCGGSGSREKRAETQSDSSDEEEDEEIIQCIQCRIAVHPSCYGLSGDEVRPNWLCGRCLAKSFLAQCELCQLRGGPLKPTSNGKWAHVTCAVVIPEVVFGDPDKREPVDLSSITKARWRLKCLYCNVHGARGGACLQCGYRKCSSSFHITCAQYNGIIHWAPDNDGSKGIRANCPRHDKDKQEEVRRELKLIQVGDTVIAKCNNSKYYHAKVTDRNEQPCFEIEFIEDESVCSNVPLSDILSDSTAVNTRVQVRWTDGLLYDGIIKAEHKEWIYSIEFEDGTVKTYPRDEVYTLQDKLPKKVQTKLSKLPIGNEMQHENSQTNNSVENSSSQ